MKKIVFLLMAAATLFTTNVVAQSVATQETKQEAVVTNYTYKDSKGIVYKVHRGAKGGYYIIRTSKNTGKEYKQYLTAEQKQKLGIK